MKWDLQEQTVNLDCSEQKPGKEDEGIEGGEGKSEAASAEHLECSSCDSVCFNFGLWLNYLFGHGLPHMKHFVGYIDSSE